jgi:nicotinamidase-related amidase
MSEDVLVIVDMQNGFCRPDGLIYVPQAEEQIPAVASAIEAARAGAVPIIYTQVLWDQPQDIVAGLRLNKSHAAENWRSPGGFRSDSWGFQVVEELAPRPGDQILLKQAFHPPGLTDMIDKVGAKNVHVTGTTANNCVYAACLAAFEADYHVYGIRDCISSFDEQTREPWLYNIGNYLGDVISLHEFTDRVSAPQAAL